MERVLASSIERIDFIYSVVHLYRMTYDFSGSQRKRIADFLFTEIGMLVIDINTSFLYIRDLSVFALSP